MLRIRSAAAPVAALILLISCSDPVSPVNRDTAQNPAAPDKTGVKVSLDPVKELDPSARQSMAATLASLAAPAKLKSGAAQAMADSPDGEESVSEPQQTVDETGAPVTLVTKTRKYKASAAYDTQVLLNPSSDVVYPGSILVGSSIDDGSYKEITGGTKRAISVSFDLSGVKDKDGNTGAVSGTVIPSLARYRELRNRILAQDVPKQSSIYSMEKIEINSQQEMGVKVAAGVGIDTGIYSASINSGFDFSKSQSTNRLMIKFMQTFYTVDVDQDSGTFLYEDFDPAIFEGYRPVYVSSIAYGRLAYLTIESSESIQSIQSNLDAAFSYGSVSAEASVEAAKSWMKSNTKTNITVIGGTAVATDLDSFISMLSQDTFSEENSGKIIAYKLRYVDDNTIANTVFNGEYTVTTQERVEGKGIDVALKMTFFDSQCDDSGGTAEYFGTIKVQKEGELDSKDLWTYSSGKTYNVSDYGKTAYDGATQTIRFNNRNEKLSFSINVKENDTSGDEKFSDPGFSIEVSKLASGVPFTIRAYLQGSTGSWIEITVEPTITVIY